MDNEISQLNAISDEYPFEKSLIEVVSRLDAVELSELLTTVVEGVHSPERRRFYLVFLIAQVKYRIVEESRAAEVYNLLAGAGKAYCGRIFIAAKPHRVASAGQGRSELADMSLGHRIWKARLHDRRLLESLATDSNPRVIRNWLANPATTELQVLSLASRRPIEVSSLLEIISNTRWSVRPEVQAALARNPYSPPNISSSLLPLLGTKLLREIAKDGSLHPMAQQTAAELLRNLTWGADRQSSCGESP